MSAFPVLKIAGLHTSDNPHSAVPEGSLVLATNAVMRYRNRLGPRRGQKRIGYSFGGGSDRSNEGVFFSDTLIQHYGTNKLTRDTGSAFSDYSGTYTPVDSATLRMKFVEAASNLYFCTNAGMKVLETAAGTPAAAGVPRARELDFVFYAQAPWLAVGYSVVGWMAPDTAVAYRFVFGIKDAAGNVKLGAPSGRMLVKNKLPATASRSANVVTVVPGSFLGVGAIVELLNPQGTFGAGPHTLLSGGLFTLTYAEVAAPVGTTGPLYYGVKNGAPSLQIPVPSGISTSHFLRIYRTIETEDADIDPGEEFYLVKEVSVASGDISNGYVNSTDYTPSSQLDTPAYWNPNDGDGEEAAKFQPPIGKDMCWWDSRLWAFNTTDKHRFHLRLLGVGSPDGVQDADTITINGVTLTAETGSVGALEFGLTTTTGSPALDTELTARQLIALINANAGSIGATAFYESGVDDAPGNILLEEVGIGGAGFTVYASRPASWGPALTTGSSGAKASTNDARPHAASYSERDEPEAFRLTSWLPIAPKNVALLRGIPFRDKLYVFGSDRKFYTITGPAPYRVDEIEGSARLVAPDSVVIHSNQVFALTDQGVGVLSDAGFRIVSNGIEDELLDVLALTASVVKQRSFACSYESDRQVHFWVPTSNSDTCATACFVYDSLRNTWTKWTGSRTWARVRSSTDLLYLGDGASNTTRVERKSRDRTDFADEEFAVTINSYDTLATVVLASAAGVAAGDVLTQFGNTYALITAVNGNTLTIASTVDADFSGPFAGTVLKAFAVAVKFAPVSPAGPRGDSRFQEACFHFGEYFAHAFAATFDSDLDATESTAVLAAATGYSGRVTSVPAASAGMRNRLCEVPQEHAECASLRVGFAITEAWASWLFDGFTLQVEPAGRGYL